MSDLTLANIVYPIFRIRSHYDIIEKDNITYIHSYRGIRILDNKNLTGNTLGLRRLRIQDKDTKYNLGLPIFNLKELLLCNSKIKKYIDNTGLVFTYKKSRFAQITYNKILEVIKIDGFGTQIKVMGINCRFKVKEGIPNLSSMWAGILTIEKGCHILYDFSDKPRKSKRVKI